MERLRFSNHLRNRILRLIQHHMRILNMPLETKEGALKRLVNQTGEETPLLVLHTLADKEASRGILSVQIDEVVEDHCLKILDLFREKDIVHPRPLITGHDVMALGFIPGPRVGQILKFIRGKQVEGEIKSIVVRCYLDDPNYYTVGTPGKNLNADRLEQLKECDRIWVVFDPDATQQAEEVARIVGGLRASMFKKDSQNE
jgi:hypothetical protein